jgi:hypothetical protein
MEIILGNLYSVKELMLKFLKSVNLKEDQGLKIYDEVVKIVKSKYDSKDKLEEIKYEIGVVPEMKMNEKVFLEPEKMITNLEKFRNVVCDDITEYIDILEHILLNPMTPRNVKDFYTKNFGDLLSIKIVQRKSLIADMTSFKNISNILIKANLEMLEKQKCNQTEHLIKDYEKMKKLI